MTEKSFSPREARIAAGITEQRAAKSVGVGLDYFRQLERQCERARRGLADFPPHHVLVRMAKAVPGASIDSFLRLPVPVGSGNTRAKRDRGETADRSMGGARSRLHLRIG